MARTKWDYGLVSTLFKESGCELLESKYKNARTSMEYRCSCGNISKITLDHFRKSHRCNLCGIKKSSTKQIKTHDQFIKEFFTLDKSNEFEILGRYTGALKEIEVLHKSCNTKWLSKSSYLLKGCGCPNCVGLTISKSKKVAKSKKFESEFLKYKDKFTLLSDYDGVHNNILIRHNECKFEFYKTPNDIYRRGLRCSRCENSSLGESLVRNILKITKEYFEEQYSFDDCIDKSKLKFDFVVFNDDKTIKYLVEFNGIQHYEPVNFGGMSNKQAKENFDNQIRRDNIKREYCKKNNIPLYEIIYSDYVKLDFFFKFNLSSGREILSLESLLKLLDRKVFFCSVPIEVISKSNNIMTTKYGRTYVPKKFKAFEDILKTYVQKEMEKKNFKKIDGPLYFHMNNYHSTRRIKDVTNSFKSVCDALNDLIYFDDSQIVSCSATKNYDKFKPRIEIIIIDLEEEHSLVSKKGKKSGPKRRIKK